MDLEKALQGGLLDAAGAKPVENDTDPDLELLYSEFKDAKDAKSGIRALKQLIRSMK